jgi:hypothetical protein
VIPAFIFDFGFSIFNVEGPSTEHFASAHVNALHSHKRHQTADCRLTSHISLKSLVVDSCFIHYVRCHVGAGVANIGVGVNSLSSLDVVALTIHSQEQRHATLIAHE